MSTLNLVRRVLTLFSVLSLVLFLNTGCAVQDEEGPKESISDTLTRIAKEAEADALAREKATEEYFSKVDFIEEKVLDFWIDRSDEKRNEEVNFLVLDKSGKVKRISESLNDSNTIKYEVSDKDYSYVKYKEVKKTTRYLSSVIGADGNPVEVSIFEYEMYMPVYYVRGED